MSDADAELKQQRRNFDLLLRAQRLGRTGYIIFDAQTNRVYWSDSLFEQRKIARRPWFTREEGLQLIHPDDRGLWDELRAHGIAERREFEHEMRVVCGDGSVVWERGSSQPQYDAAGNFTGLLSVVDDITEEKNAAASLMAQEATYRALFNSIGDAIFLSRNGVFVDCNDAALTTFGATREQLIAHSPVEFSPPLQPDGRPSRAAAQEKIAAALAGRRQVFEWRHCRVDGTEFDAEVVLSRVEGSAAGYFFGVVRDISERKQAEKALQASHDKFAGAFSASTDAMVVIRMTGGQYGSARLLDANAAALAMFGLDRAAMIGKTAAEVNVVPDEVDSSGIRRIMIENGEIRGFATKLRHSSGRLIDVEISGSLFDAADDDLALLVIRDVTEQQAAARRIGELNRSLEANLRQMRAITDNLPVGVSQTAMDGRILFLNKTLERWLAVDTEHARGRFAAELFPKDYVDATMPMREAFAAGVRTVEQTLPLPDGATRTVEATNIPDFDAAGTQQGNFGFIVDITERKRAEAELRASHEKFASAFESSADAMVVTTTGENVWEGVILELNRAAEKMFELSREALVGKPLSAFRDRMGNFDVPSYRRVMTADGSVRDLAVTIPRAKGSPIHALVSGSRFFVGDKPHTLTIIRDVTETLAAEHKIRELNATLKDNLRLLRAVADNLPVAIAYQDAENRFLFVNRTLEQWFASTEAEMLGRTVPEFVSNAYLVAVEPVRQALAAGRTTVEVTLPFPDGKIRTVDSTMIIDRDEKGAPRGRYSLLVDMTERKAAEEQMQQAQKMQAIGKLTGGVAHDFNNLLAVIAGNLDLATERNQDRAIAKLLEPARRAAERGSTLTKSLLAFARQQPLSPQVSDLNLLARDMTELLRRTLPSNIGIEFVGGAGLWKTEVDPGQLQNALLNLVVNARDAMPDGGRLTVETQNARVDAGYAATHELAAGQYVMLAVSDTGTGMPPDVVARAFEPFYTTKGVGEGTGLGLSMVYGFAKQSGGHVAIYSEIGDGTTVKLYLPRWISKDGVTPTPADRLVPTASNETVLVVEDDPDMRLIAVTMLRSLGYAVIEAPDGNGALKALAENPAVALLVTDVVLAGAMNGRRLAEEARRLNPRLKVLFMSGYTEDAIVHHGRLNHGVHFIQKPFRKQDLAAKAREALDGEPH